MSNLEKVLKDVAYFGVGAAATVIEAGGKAVKALVDKGEKTLRDNQDTVDDIVRKAKDFGDKVKDAVEKATAPVEEVPAEEVPAEPAAPEVEFPDEPVVPEVKIPDEPVVPDAIYRTEIPAEEESDAPAEDPAPAEPPILEIPEENDARDPFTRYNP